MKTKILFMILLCGCAPPDDYLTKQLGDGVKCKADIIAPDVRPGESITVDVKIYNCVKTTP